MAAVSFQHEYLAKYYHSDATTSLVGDSDKGASGRYEFDGTDDEFELQESANAWILSQQEQPLLEQQTTSADITTEQRLANQYDLLPLDRRHSFQYGSMLPELAHGKAVKGKRYISKHHQLPLSSRHFSESNMKPSNRRPSIPKTKTLIHTCPLPPPPPRNGSTLGHPASDGSSSQHLEPPPFLVSQSSRTSLYSTSDCSSFMYISAKPSMMVSTNPDPTGSAKILPVRPAPPPPTITNKHANSDFSSYDSVAGVARLNDLSHNYIVPFQQETHFCLNSTTRPGIYSCSQPQPDNYSLYSASSSISNSFCPLSISRQKYTCSWLDSVTSQPDLSTISLHPGDLQVQYPDPPAYDEIQSSSIDLTQGSTTVPLYENRTLTAAAANIYNYPTVLINGNTEDAILNSTKYEEVGKLEVEVEEEEEEDDGQTINIASHYDTQSSSIGDSTKRYNPSPSCTFTTTLSSDMMDPSSMSGIFRKHNSSSSTINKVNIKERFNQLGSSELFDIESDNLNSGKNSKDSTSSDFNSISPTPSFGCRFLMGTVAVLIALLAVAVIGLLLYCHYSDSQSDVITFLKELVGDNLLVNNLQAEEPGKQPNTTINWTTTTITAYTSTSLPWQPSTNASIVIE